MHKVAGQAPSGAEQEPVDDQPIGYPVADTRAILEPSGVSDRTRGDRPKFEDVERRRFQ
jgi:hypothetical protein